MKLVQHFCAACWLRDRTSKKWHPESSLECPCKELWVTLHNPSTTPSNHWGCTCSTHFNTTEPTIEAIVQDLMLGHTVIKSGQPNKFKCHIPLKTNLKIQNFHNMLVSYHDQEVIEWLTYGFSISRDSTAVPPIPACKNHAGANQYPQHIADYLQKEVRLGATIGAFSIPPLLGNIGISPLNTRPKKRQQCAQGNSWS